MKNYSNYHNIDNNQKIKNDGLLLLERSLNGFEGYEVFINNSINPTKVLIYQKYDLEGNIKKIIGYSNDIDIGNIVTFNNNYWLIVTFPEDNKIYRKAEIQLCNSTFPLKGNKTENLLGYDQFNRPIYKKDYEIIDTPCIVETTYARNNSDDETINLPKGQIKITLPFSNSDSFKINENFEMYNNQYSIVDINYTKVINNKGIISFIAERVVND